MGGATQRTAQRTAADRTKQRHARKEKHQKDKRKGGKRTLLHHAQQQAPQLSTG